jgi:hypothetical protein
MHKKFLWTSAFILLLGLGWGPAPGSTMEEMETERVGPINASSYYPDQVEKHSRSTYNKVEYYSNYLDLEPQIKSSIEESLLEDYPNTIKFAKVVQTEPTINWDDPRMLSASISSVKYYADVAPRGCWQKKLEIDKISSQKYLLENPITIPVDDTYERDRKNKLFWYPCDEDFIGCCWCHPCLCPY